MHEKARFQVQEQCYLSKAMYQIKSLSMVVIYYARSTNLRLKNMSCHYLVRLDETIK